MEGTKENSRGITIIVLVITIIILLILAGITITTLKNTGLFERAKEAKELTLLKTAEEKVKLAVIASYGESGTIENKHLKQNLTNSEGIEKIKTSSGEEISTDIKNEDYPLIVQVDGYEFQVNKEGTVASTNNNNFDQNTGNNEQNNSVSDYVLALEQEIQELKNKIDGMNKIVYTKENAKEEIPTKFAVYDSYTIQEDGVYHLEFNSNGETRGIGRRIIYITINSKSVSQSESYSTEEDLMPSEEGNQFYGLSSSKTIQLKEGDIVDFRTYFNTVEVVGRMTNLCVTKLK